MRALVLILVLVLAAFSFAQERRQVGSETVGEVLEKLRGSTEANTNLIRAAYASGLATGIHAAGVECRQGYAVGELLAYLMHRAAKNEFAMLAAADFFHERGCKLDPESPYISYSIY